MPIDSQPKLWLGLLLLLLSPPIPGSNASIHFYHTRDSFKEVSNALFFSGGSEGIASSRESSSDRPPSINDGRSYIRFENITFWRSKESSMDHNTDLIQVVIFEAADRDNIGGSAYGGQRAVCCTPDLAKLEGCRQGRVIRIPSATDVNWPVVLDVQFSGNAVSTTMDDKEVYITKSGMYNLFFIACNQKLKGLNLSGKSLWKNPDGYLPGRMAPLMKFYALMVLLYVLLTVIWVFQYVRFWKDILQLQHCITAVIVLGLFEMILWYFEYLHFSRTGMRPVQITTWVVTVGALRKTLSRLLILSVSMGYGVVRPTLGGLTSKVLLVGVTYFLASELLDITENVGTINDISGRARLLLVLPDALLNAFLILWIFTSLSKTLELLQAKRNSVKLDIYRKFSNALVIAVAASVAWVGYEVYFKATDPYNERWQSAWIITAFWDLSAFLLLNVICFLWAPSQSSQRYAYSGEMGEEFDAEETQPLNEGRIECEVSLVVREEDVENKGNEENNEDDEVKRE